MSERTRSWRPCGDRQCSYDVSRLIAVARLGLKGGRKAECSAALMLEVKHYMCLSEEPRFAMLRRAEDTEVS